MIGLGLGLNKHIGPFDAIPFRSDALHYSTDDGLDKTGTSTRPSVSPKVFNQAGTTYLQFSDYPNTSLTYFDVVLGSEQTDTTDGSGNWTLPANKVSYSTVGGHTFTPNEVIDPTDNSQAKVTSLDGEVTAYAFNTTSTWVIDDYENGLVECDEYGYTLADGSTIYRDELLTELYVLNQPICALQDETGISTSKCKGWVSDGAGGSVQADLEFKGRIKHSLDYNEGSFTANGTDNYLDTGIVPNQDTIIKQWKKFNVLNVYGATGARTDSSNELRYGTGTSNNLQFDYGAFSDITLSVDTDLHLYEINDGQLLIDGSVVSGTKGTSIGTVTESIYLMGANILGVLNGPTDETMYKTEIIHNGQTHIWDFNPNNDETVVYTIDGVEQTAPTIQGTVTSAQWETTGYLRATDEDDSPYSLMVQADTADIFYDDTDPSAPVAKTLAVADLTREMPLTDPYVFFNLDNGNVNKAVVYNRTFDFDERNIINQRLGNLTTLATSDGSLSTTDGLLKVLK